MIVGDMARLTGAWTRDRHRYRRGWSRGPPQLSFRCLAGGSDATVAGAVAIVATSALAASGIPALANGTCRSGGYAS